MKVIFEEYALNDWYSDNLLGLQQCFPVFEYLVQRKLPQLHNYLTVNLAEQVGVQHYSALFLTNWFLELFYDSLGWPLMLKVWDLFFFVGPRFAYEMGISILEDLQGLLFTLDENDTATIISAVKNPAQHDFNSEAKLLVRAYKYKITNQEIAALRKRVKANE